MSDYIDPFDPRYPDSAARLASIVRQIAEDAMPISITRANVDDLLDRGQIEVRMKSGAWWSIRRNGKTQLWKSQPERIRIPYKYGMKGYGAITTWDFSGHARYDGENVTTDMDGELRPTEYRVKPPAEVR